MSIDDERHAQVPAPGVWELQRRIDKVDEDRRQDFHRLEERHAADRAEITEAIQRMGLRLERIMRESAGVPLGTWQAHNQAVDSELKYLRERVEGVQRLVVGTLLTMIAGGVAVAAASGLFAA